MREFMVGMVARLNRWFRRGDRGMSTAEYAVGTVAAVAFAAALYKVVNSPTVMHALTTIVGRALRAPF